MAWRDAASAVILVDAVAVDGAPAGTLVRLEGDEVPSAIVHRLSPHQIGVADLLDGLWLLDRTPPRLILLGLVPASLDLGVEPTSAVAAAIPGLVEEIAREAAALGHPFRRRISHEVPDLTNDLGVFHGLDL
jgi:hydrogenase maturation protease